MSTTVHARPVGARRTPVLPAYGPVDACLGYLVFYVFVDRATPTVVEVVTGALSGVPGSAVRVGLGFALWFVLAVTVIDQLRRQYEAYVAAQRDEAAGHPEPWLLAHLLLVLGPGAIAVLTFDGAVETGIRLIELVATLDVAAFPPVDVALMVVFFVAFGLSSWALDRLLIGGLRELLAG